MGINIFLKKCNDVNVIGIFKSKEMVAELIMLSRCVVIKERDQVRQLLEGDDLFRATSIIAMYLFIWLIKIFISYFPASTFEQVCQHLTSSAQNLVVTHKDTYFRLQVGNLSKLCYSSTFSRNKKILDKLKPFTYYQLGMNLYCPEKVLL